MWSKIEKKKFNAKGHGGQIEVKVQNAPRISGNLLPPQSDFPFSSYRENEHLTLRNFRTGCLIKAGDGPLQRAYPPLSYIQKGTTSIF